MDQKQVLNSRSYTNPVQGTKTHLTMWPGGRKKFSFHSVLQEICQNMFLPASLRFPIVKIIEITYKVKQRTSDILRVKWLFILYTGDTVKIWTSLSSCFSEITNGLVNRIADPSLHSSYSFCNYYTRLYSYLWFLTILNESWLFSNFLHCRKFEHDYLSGRSKENAFSSPVWQ